MLQGQDVQNANLGRRAAIRIRRYSAAILVDGMKYSAINCLIRNVSISGAQVRVNGSHAFAYDSYLIDLGSKTAYLAHPVWRNGSLVGLSFEKAFAINYELPENLSFLKRLYIEAKQRQEEIAPPAIVNRRRSTREPWQAAHQLLSIATAH